MRKSKQSASVWTNEEPSRQELVAYLEAENAMLRGRALKLASEIRTLREAMGDGPSENTPAQHRRQGESVVVH
jgi:hypothetical protein